MSMFVSVSQVISSPISVGLANIFLQKLGFPVMFMIQASFVCVSKYILIKLNKTYKLRQL